MSNNSNSSSSSSKHIICVSGGGTKAIGLSTLLERALETHGMPLAYVGTSSGAIVSLPMLMGYYEQTHNKLLTAKTEDFFDRKLNWVAVVDALYQKVVKKRNNIGLSSMHALVNSYKELVTEEAYNEFRSKSDRPEIYVGTVNVDNGAMRYIPLFDYEYEEVLQWITASSSIPMVAKPVYGKYVDGGLRHHIGSKFLLNKYGKDVDKCISIYSRPRTLDGVIDENNFIFDKMLSIIMMQLSKADEVTERNMCELQGIDLYQYFLPKVMQSTYDVDPNRLRELQSIAKTIEPIVHKFK